MSEVNIVEDLGKGIDLEELEKIRKENEANDECTRDNRKENA